LYLAGEHTSGPVGPVIELDGLTVTFGRRVILDDLRASLAGRAIGLLGPNGAGKTTLIHTLLGFHAASSGTARVLGLDIGNESRAVRNIVGYMPETEAFVAEMTAVRFVRQMAELSGLPREAALERAHEALYYVGLGEARYRAMDSYSLGMRQKVKLAQAIAHGPRLLFLDEPTNGLDPPARQRMLHLIREIRDTGEVCIVLSSHLLRDVEDTCDEVLILKDGQVAATCDLAADRRSNRKFLELELSGDSRGFAEVVAGMGCEYARSGLRRIKLVVPQAIEVRDLYRAASDSDVQIRHLTYKHDSLEDIFLKAMEGGDGRI